MNTREFDKFVSETITQIYLNGYETENPRPRYESDGAPANSKFITNQHITLDLSKDVPCSSLRKFYPKTAVNEMLTIYQDQTSDLQAFRDRGVNFWESWKIDGEDSIGTIYGHTVAKHNLIGNLLDGLVNDPFGRRHIMNLWQLDNFEEGDHKLVPCAFQTIWNVCKKDDKYYLDMMLTQRSSDFIVASSFNIFQYSALQMIVAKHCGYEVGKITWSIANVHIYDRYVDIAKDIADLYYQNILEQKYHDQDIKFYIKDRDDFNFYNASWEDFVFEGYEPNDKVIKFDMAI